MRTLREYIDLVNEAQQVKFPITPAMIKQVKESGHPYLYYGDVAPEAESKQVCTMINKTVGSMLPAEACKFDLSDMSMDSGILSIIQDATNRNFPHNDEHNKILLSIGSESTRDADYEPGQILDCAYDTEIRADGTISHTIGINAGYALHTSKGFVTRILGQLYRGMEYLHGPGQRTMAINDDKGAGVWQAIMAKLNATQEM